MTIRLIPGIGFMEEQRTAQAIIPGIGYVDDPGLGITELFIDGPGSAVVGAPTDNIIVTITGDVIGIITVTPSDNGAGGTFSPSYLTLTQSLKSATFTYTAVSAGLKTITLTNNGGLENPDALYIAATALPSGVITSVVVSGQTVTVSGTTSNEPVSGTASLQADNPANGAVSQGPKALTLGVGTFTVEFMGVPAGDYVGEVVTLNNVAGPAQASGSSPFKIIGISGNPEGQASTPAAPTNIVAVVGNGSATVNCTPPDDGGTAITSYEVLASTGQTASSSTLPVSMSVPNGVSVTFRIRAVNSAGPGEYSLPSNSVTPFVPYVSTIEIDLLDKNNQPLASGITLSYSWFDQDKPEEFLAPVSQGTVVTTGETSYSFEFPESALSTHGIGWLIISDSSGDPTSIHRAFSGPVTVL